MFANVVYLGGREMWLLLAFIAVPLIEIALFIEVGSWLGLWPTLLIVLLTAIAGPYLVRTQGRSVLDDLRNSFDDLRDPTQPLAHGAMILFSGALLLTPGFFTDVIGFLLLVPAVRNVVFVEVSKRIRVQRAHAGTAGHARGHRAGPNDASTTIIEAEYEVENPPQAGPSGWRRE